MTKIKLNPRYTFNNFIVGKFNEFPYAVAEAVVSEPVVKYNPLFIYGRAGQGKTHLIQAIGNKIKRLHKDKKVLYVTSEVLMKDLISGFRKKSMDEFQKKYLKCDVIIIDDLQFIAGKLATEEEIIHFFDLLLKNNKQIIASLGDEPKSFIKLTDHARRNYEAGIIAGVGKPDEEARKAIIKAKADKKNIHLTKKVLNFLVQATGQCDIRKLEGILNVILVRTTQDYSHKILRHIIKYDF